MKGKTLLLSISAILLLFLAQPAGAQSAKISVKMENVSVKVVLDKIQTMTDYAFFYNNTEIDDSRIVSVDAKDKTIPQILSQIIPGVKCRFENKKIVLVTESSAAESVKPQTSQGGFTIRGTIKDEDGEPLPGASAIVVISGKTYGSVADFDGSFVLDLLAAPDKKQTILFSCIGFTDVSELISGRANFEVVMKTDSELLAETVVVGYGVQKKVNLTGAVAAVSAKEIEKRPVANVGRHCRALFLT